MKQSEVRVGTYAMLTVRGRALRVLVRYRRTPERAGDVRWACVDDNGDYHEATPRRLRPVSSGPTSLGQETAQAHYQFMRDHFSFVKVG